MGDSDALIEQELRRVGSELAASFPSSTRHPMRALDARAMDMASSDRELRAALFRFVDVVPACRSLDDLARHLTGFLDELPDTPPPISAAMRISHTRAGRAALGAAAAGGVQPPRPPLHRRRDARRAALGDAAPAVGPRRRQLGRPARRGDGHRGRGRPLRRPLRARRSSSSRRPRARWPERPALEADGVGPLPRANVCVKVSALTPLLRPDAPELRPARRRRAPAAAAAPRAASSAPTCTSTWSRWTRARRCSSWCSSCSTRRSSATARRPGSCSRPTCVTRPISSTQIVAWAGATAAPPAADRPAGQGRLLGPRARPGPPARLAGAGVRGQARLRPQLRGADPRPAGRPAGASAWRSPRTTCARWPTPSPSTASRAARTATSSFRCCADSATSSSTRWPRAATACATYCPVGDLVAGMAYLVRRLLENTSNESFLSEQARGRAAGAAAGGAVRLAVRAGSWGRGALTSAAPHARTICQRADPRAPPRPRSLRSSPTRWREWTASCRSTCRVLVGDDSRPGAELTSTDPGSPSGSSPGPPRRARRDVQAAIADGRARASRLAGRVGRRARRARCSRRPRGCASGASSSPRWRCASAPSRGPRPTPTSARRSTSSSTTRGPRSSSSAGRSCCRSRASATSCSYAPRGIVAVISPWNFPLAIPCGMTAAALATGNAVVLKPAEQSPGCAAAPRAGAARRRRSAGGARAAAGRGRGRRRAGAPSRAWPRSRSPARCRSAARSFAAAADTADGQRHFKRVIAELGGKNCVIVDADADLDEAVPAIVGLGVRLRRPEVLGRLPRARPRGDRRAAARAPRRRRPGAGRRPGRDARHRRAAGDRARRRRSGSTATPRSPRRHGPDRGRRRAAPGEGWFCPATVAADLPADSPVLDEEIFGPLLAVERGARRRARLRRRRRAALRAHRRPVHPRSRRPSAGSAQRTPVGNLYVNRGITGAMVARQPFGGNRLSGTGPKAGGPGLPAAVRRAARGEREHDAPRAGGLSPAEA